jgi:hypothetical protein
VRELSSQGDCFLPACSFPEAIVRACHWRTVATESNGETGQSYEILVPLAWVFLCGLSEVLVILLSGRIRSRST